MRADLPIAALPHVAHCTVTDCEDPPGKRLEVREGGELLAEATIGRPVAGIGVLWWIGVTQAARGWGLDLGLPLEPCHQPQAGSTPGLRWARRCLDTRALT